MSVRTRIEDAGILLQNKRLEGAFGMVLIAIAATSRKRYPQGTPSKWKPKNKMGDCEAFKTFMAEEIDKVMPFNVRAITQFRDGKTPLSDLLYEVMRCDLIHEGKLPSDVSMSESQDAQIKVGPTLVFSGSFVDQLANAVIQAEENKDLFPERDKSWPSWLTYKRGEK
jgi:hypothetical protein